MKSASVSRSPWRKIFGGSSKKSGGASDTATTTTTTTHGEIEYQTRPKFQRKTSDRHETCRELRREAMGEEEGEKPLVRCTEKTPSMSSGKCKSKRFWSSSSSKPQQEAAPTSTTQPSTSLAPSKCLARSGPLAKAKTNKPRLPRGSLTVDKLSELDRALSDLIQQRKTAKDLYGALQDDVQDVEGTGASLQIIRSRMAVPQQAAQEYHDDDGDDEDDTTALVLASMPVLSRHPRRHDASNPFEEIASSSTSSEGSSQQQHRRRLEDDDHSSRASTSQETNVTVPTLSSALEDATVKQRPVSQPVSAPAVTRSFSDTPFGKRPTTATSMSSAKSNSSRVKRYSLLALNSLGGYAPSPEMRRTAAM